MYCEILEALERKEKGLWQSLSRLNLESENKKERKRALKIISHLKEIPEKRAPWIQVLLENISSTYNLS